MSLFKPQNSKEKQSRTPRTIERFIQAIKNTAVWFKGAWQRTSFENSQAYRQQFLISDIAQARVVVFLLALTIVFYNISDYVFFNFSNIYYGLLALRVGMLAYCIWQLIYLRKVRNYRTFDRAIFSYMLVLVIGILIINSSRIQNFLPHVIVIDVAVFVFYLVMPTRFLYQAVPSIVFSIGQVLQITLTPQWFMATGVVTALSSLLFANIVAALCSLQMHAYRWRIYQNVSERKDTERLVAIGQTAGMIGHDIRNPLQAIVSELYIAKDALTSSPYSEEAKRPAIESIELIEEQTDYISKIVSDLQDYARPLKPEYKETDLGKIVTSVFQVVRIPNKIELKVDVHGFPTIKTDQTFIRRAITNLINNAIQAMPEGGKLELTARKMNNTAVLTVSDTGKGIPEEVKPRLFTPLVTTKAKGQGLGLVVVKRLIEALGGTITFESQPDKGTIFKIELPLPP